MRPFIIFALLISTMLTAQENEKKLLTPQEMRADVDFYFEALHHNHPDPYYYCPLREFESLREKIYSQLDKPLTYEEFGWIVGEINSCVDAHSSISFREVVFQNAKEEYFREGTRLFPSITIRDNQLFLINNDEDFIEEINGVLAGQIISDSWKYFNWRWPHKINYNELETHIIHLLHFKYGIRAPYKVKFSKSTQVETIEGVNALDKFETDITIMGMRTTFPLDTTRIYQPYGYKIYPANSMAIFYINSFLNQYQENFQETCDKFMEEIDTLGIKNIFYDLSKNGGGHEMGQYKIFDAVKHDTVYFRYSKIIRNNHVNKKHIINEAILEPNKIGKDDRQLFFIQSIITKSRADYFCRIVAQNNLGVRVGQDTGEPTVAFSITPEYKMPNSQIVFNVAAELLDFSDYFDSDTLKPDMYWDVNHSREFSEKELLDIINHWKNNKRTYVQIK